MSLYAEISATVRTWTDSAKQSCKFGLVIDDLVLDNTLDVSAGARITLGAGATDVPASFQSITSGQLVVLSSASEFQVKFNGAGNDALTLKPQSSEAGVVVPAFLIILADSLTSIHLTNPDVSNEIQVDVGVAGT